MERLSRSCVGLHEMFHAVSRSPYCCQEWSPS